MKTILLTIIATIFFLNVSAVTTYTVTSSADPDAYYYHYDFDDTKCDPVMYGTLQWAIRKALDTPGECRIVFNIPGSSPVIIFLNFTLPTLERKAITIDATTQPGYSQGNPQIILDGNMHLLTGLYFNNLKNSEVKGIVFKHFVSQAVMFNYANSFSISDCYFVENGSQDSPVFPASLRIVSSTNGSIKGNYFGIDPSGNITGNSAYGMVLSDNSNTNTIGGINSGEGNFIVNNQKFGIWITNSSRFNKISGNIIYGSNFAINLDPDGNQLKHSPSINNYDNTTYILRGGADPYDIVDIFGSNGSQSANEYITTVQAGSNGKWEILATTNYPDYVATATDLQNNTSMLSNPFQAQNVTTGLLSSDCNISDVLFSQILTATPVYRAEMYEFKITDDNTGISENIVKNTNSFSLNELNMPIQLNTPYKIEVRMKIGELWGQFGSICKVTTVKSTTINTCTNEEIPFLISGVGAGNLINISVNLPAGVYGLHEAAILGDTSTIITIDTSNTSVPQYSFIAPSSAAFTFYYYIKAGCEHISASTTNFVDSIILNDGGIITQHSNNYSLSSPWLIFDDSLSQNLYYSNAYLHVPFTRTFVYKNTGNLFTGDFIFRDTANPAVNITGITCLTPSVSIISTVNLGSSVSFKVHINNMGFNDTIVIRENVELINCPLDTNNLTRFNAYYGCTNDSLCKRVSSSIEEVTSVKEDPNDKPVIKYELLTEGYPACWSSPMERIIKITNTGDGIADSTLIEIFKTSATFHNITENITDSVRIYKLNGYIYVPGSNFAVINSLNSCQYKILEQLLPDSSIYIRYYEVIHCIDSINYPQYFNSDINMHFEGFPVVTLFHKCFPQVSSYDNTFCDFRGWEHTSSLDQVFNNYIGTMNGGDEAWFDINSSTPLFIATTHVPQGYQQGFIFDVANSAIQVTLKLEKGLGLVEDSLYLLSSINGAPVRISASQWYYNLGTPADTGNGNIITANFAIPDSFYTHMTTIQPFGFVDIPTQYYHDFFNNFRVHFRLHAYCEHMMTKPSKIEQEFYFIPNLLCNPDCKLPLASKADSINIHCPGCKLPGWNLNSFNVKRINLGLADNDNNNFPDSYNPIQPADPALIQIQNAMVGDELEFEIDGNTSDGGNIIDSLGVSHFIGFNNIGFDYTYGQLQFKAPFGMNKLRFINASGYISDSTGNHPFFIPQSSGQYYPEGFAISMDMDSLHSFGVPATFQRYWNGNNLHIKLNFKVIHNFQNPYMSILGVDAQMNMSGTPYPTTPTGIEVKTDAGTIASNDPDLFLAMNSFQKADLNYWCTGWDGNFGAIGVDYNFNASSATPIIKNSGSYVNEYHPCKNVIWSFFNTEVGHTVYSELYGQGEQIPWNAFSYELRNLWMLDSITVNFPKDFYLDSVILVNTQLTTINGLKDYTTTDWNPLLGTAHYSYDMSDVLATDSSATIYPFRNYDSITAFPGNVGPPNQKLFGWDESKRYRIFFFLGNDSCAPPLVYPNTNNYPVISYISNFPGTTTGDSIVTRIIQSGEFTRPDASLITTVDIPIIQDSPNSDLNINLTLSTAEQDNPSVPFAILHGIAENTFIYIHSPSGTVVIDSIVNYQTNSNFPIVDTIGTENVYGIGMVGHYWGSANLGIFASYDCENISAWDSVLVYTGWNCAGYPSDLNNVCYLDSQWVSFKVIKPGLLTILHASDTLQICETLQYDLLLTPTDVGNVNNVIVNIPVPQNGEFIFEQGSAVLLYNGDTIPVPAPTGTDTLSFNLSSPGLLDNFDVYEAHFLFNIIPGCSFYQSQTEVELLISAQNYCGNNINTVPITHRPHTIMGFPTQDSLSVNISTIATVSGCGDNTLVQVTVTNEGTSTTDTLNTLNIVLPNSFAWSGGDVATTVAGQTYTYELDSILPTGSQTIQFYIAGISGSGVFNVIASAYVAQPIICNNDICVLTQSFVEATDTALLNVNHLNITLNTVNVNCYGLCNGSADVTCTGIAPFSYLWSNGATTQSVNGLCAANDSIIVTDANNCTDTILFTITEPEKLLVNIIATHATCPGVCDGAASAIVTGGITPYAYLWSDGSNSQPNSELCAGAYLVTVTDSNGCTMESNTTILNGTAPLPVATFSITHPTDTNYIRELDAIEFTSASQAGVTYTWNFGDSTSDTGNVVNHTFQDFGYFNVSLTASTQCGSAISCQTIYVLPSSYDLIPNFDISDNYIVQGNEVWNTSTITVQGLVIIPQGDTLNIEGINVQFSPKGRIIVQRGGILIVNSSKLSSIVSGTMWQGIEVWGDGSRPSTHIVQGKAILKQSTIVDAHIAVLLGRRNMPSCTDDVSPFNLGFSGGVINAARDINFINNGISVKFTWKSNTDGVANVIDDCNFKCQSLLSDEHYDKGNTSISHYPNNQNPWAGYANYNQRTDIGIQADNIKRLTINRDTMENLEYGIFTINNQQTFVIRCSFRNHRQGIHIENINPGMSNYYDITKCTFDYIPGNTSGTLWTDDGTAIYIAGGRGDKIHDDNNFRNTYSGSNPTYGIKTNNTSSLDIRNNYFLLLTNGVTIQNSLPFGGSVRAYQNADSSLNYLGNIFTTCKAGIITKNNNSALCLRCNDHTPATSSTIMNWDNNFNSTLANQGFDPGTITNCNTKVKYGAGNLFLNGSNKKIKTVLPYKYYHHTDPNTIPVIIGSITLSNIGCPNTGGKQFTCPVPTPPILNINLPNSLNDPVFLRIDSLNNVALALESQYQTLINNVDKGHTQELLNAINTVPPSGQLKNMLIANSPLSDTVLITLNNQNPLSNGNYKNVMEENLPVTRNVVPSFNNRVETLPPGIKNQLIEKQASNPGKITIGYLETMLSEAKLAKQLYFNEIISLLLDTLNNRDADAITIFERQATPAANMTLAANYMNDSNYSTALSKLALLPNDDSEIGEWKTFAVYILNKLMQGKTLEEFDSNQVEYIRTIAYQCPEGIATVNAKAVLMYLYREEVTACPENGEQSMRLINNNFEPSKSSYLGENYPDPFSRNTVIPYYLPEGSKGEIEIKDVTGRIILTLSLHEGDNTLQIDSKEWADGIYFYGMKINDENIENKKMIKSE